MCRDPILGSYDAIHTKFVPRLVFVVVKVTHNGMEWFRQEPSKPV